jgi:CRP/FNR family transcriptional regulator, cyclic AMP receptor protein
VNVHEPLTPLLDLDADLGRLLGPERAAEAHAELGVRVCLIERGPWDAGRLATAHPENLELLLLSGVMAREILLADTVSTELLGPGDVLRPWHSDEPHEHRRGLLPPESPQPVEVLEVPHSTLSEWVLTGNGRPPV